MWWFRGVKCLLFIAFHFSSCYSLLRLRTELEVVIDNRSGGEIKVDWIHPNTNELLEQSTIRDQYEHRLNSFAGHSFLIYRNGAKRKERTSDSAYFSLTNLDTVVQVTTNEDGDLHLKVSTPRTEVASTVRQVLENCHSQTANEKAKWEIDSDGEYYLVEGGSEGSLMDCASTQIAALMMEQERERHVHTKMHSDMRDTNRDYVCANTSVETSEPIRTSRWKGKQVDTLFDYHRAKIQLIHNFVSEDECAYLMEKAAPRLRKATVAGATLSSTSDGRRAKQASVDVDFDDKDCPAAALAKRAYAYANFSTGYGLPTDGQEDFTVIKYDPTDEYKPHCDADCGGSVYKNHGRVATMVVYCEVPIAGGATTFDNANRVIKPKKGDASFFSYLGEDGYWDDGLTLHSGCPIIEGEKWIATLWMRLGVSDEDPWVKYDPVGNLAY